MSVFFLKLLIALGYLFIVRSEWDLNSWFIIGIDEKRYFELSRDLWEAISSKGFLYALENYYYFTRSEHFLYYFIVAPFFWFAEPLFPMLIAKSLLFALSANYVYQLSKIWYGQTVARLAVCALFLYYPLQLLSLTYMRDDVIFFLCVGIFFYAVTNDGGRVNFFVLLAYLVFLFFLRVHAALACAVFALTYNYKYFIVKIKLTYVLFFVLGVFAVVAWRLDFILRVLDKLPLLNLFFNFPVEVVRLVMAPNPFNVSESYQALGLHYWYSLSLPISVVGAGLFVLILVKTKINRKVFSVICFSVIYLAPYVAIENLGFRQLAIIAPIIFILVSISYFQARLVKGN